MPKIKVDHVVTFSSEDPVHVANNVLLSDPAKKWKCKTQGERSASVVLQLEKATQITAVDIGNENSAYIEVLVSRSGDDFKVLLVMSSFMTASESRQSTNMNKVRMFTRDQLSKPECDQKWDRVKIVCTQPFNRHVQYGLSFITFHSADSGTSVNNSVDLSIAKRSESPLETGSVFAKWKEQQSEPLFSIAKAIRDSSNSPKNSLLPSQTKKKITIIPNSSRKKPIKESSDDEGEVTRLERNRSELLYDSDDDKPNQKIDKLIEAKMKERERGTEKQNSVMTTPKAGPSGESSNSSKRKIASENKNEQKNTSNSPKRTRLSLFTDINKSDPSPKAPERRRKPFGELLSGVTLVISGIQNPDRGNLRTKALEMGAKYKPDWEDNTCTHLICAFSNTPKFQQVKGKGKIVKKKWIEDCHSQRKRLPWRRYCLDKDDSKSPESEDEIWEGQAEEATRAGSTKTEKEKKETKQRPGSGKGKKANQSSDDEYNGFDDTEMQKRIAEIQAKNIPKLTDNKSQAKEFLADTDDEDVESDRKSDNQDVDSCPLLDLFKQRLFFIDETLDEDIRATLRRYVIAYNGILAENPSNEVYYFLSTEDTVDTLREFNPKAEFVRPDWLWHCHNQLRLVSTDEYTL